MANATKDDLRQTEDKLDGKIQKESDNRHTADEYLTKQYFTLLEKVDDQLPNIFDKLNDIALKLNTNDEKTKNIKSQMEKMEGGVSSKLFYSVVVPFMVGSVLFAIKVITDVSTIKAVLKISNIE